MNRQKLITVLAEYGIHPSKAKGQNFLVDKNMLDAMVRSMELQDGEQILEVGPGTGVLTRILVEAGCQLTSVETDKKLYKYVSENIIADNFSLVFGDACRVNYNDIIDFTKDYRCIANLPYAISSVFIAKMTLLKKPPTEMFFLLQKEMAERFSAKPHTKKYGSLTVRAGVLYDSKILRTVPPQVFHPPPKVDSAFIQMKLKKTIPSKECLTNLNKLVKVAFSQRRKKAFKLICAVFPKESVLKAYNILEFDENIRAENIEINQYLQFAEILTEKDHGQ